MNRYEDKRILKSRQKIRDSFSALLLEQPLRDISIQAICQKAQISRTTFYSHFSGKEAIIQSFQTEVAQEVFSAAPDSDRDVRHFLEKVVTVWDRHYQTLRLLLSANENLQVDQKTQELLEMRFKNRILPLLSLEKGSSENCNYLAAFYAGGTYAVLKKWLTADVRLSPQELLEKLLLIFPKENRESTKIYIPAN